LSYARCYSILKHTGIGNTMGYEHDWQGKLPQLQGFRKYKDSIKRL